MSVDGPITPAVFDTTGPCRAQGVFHCRADRLVIDISDATVASDFSAAEIEDIHLGGLRPPRPDGGLRVVLDLKQPVRPKTFC